MIKDQGLQSVGLFNVNVTKFTLQFTKIVTQTKMLVGLAKPPISYINNDVTIV